MLARRAILSRAMRRHCSHFIIFTAARVFSLFVAAFYNNVGYPLLYLFCPFGAVVANKDLYNHRLNGSSSHALTATSLSYGKAKNSTPHGTN